MRLRKPLGLALVTVVRCVHLKGLQQCLARALFQGGTDFSHDASLFGCGLCAFEQTVHRRRQPRAADRRESKFGCCCGATAHAKPISTTACWSHCFLSIESSPTEKAPYLLLEVLADPSVVCSERRSQETGQRRRWQVRPREARGDEGSSPSAWRGRRSSAKLNPRRRLALCANPHLSDLGPLARTRPCSLLPQKGQERRKSSWLTLNARDEVAGETLDRGDSLLLRSDAAEARTPPAF